MPFGVGGKTNVLIETKASQAGYDVLRESVLGMFMWLLKSPKSIFVRSMERCIRKVENFVLKSSIGFGGQYTV